MGSVTITEIDMGWDDYVSGSESIASAKGSIEGKTGVLVEAGLLDDDATDDDGASLAEIGAWQELGTRTIRARPWMSLAADQNGPTIFEAGVDAALQVIDGRPLKPAYQAFGNKVVRLEREVIMTNNVGGPPLKPETVRAKGFDKKLVDSGDMVDNLDAEVIT